MTPKYIVAYDGKPAAQAALRFAHMLARDTCAEIVAAHVYPSLVGLYAPSFGAVAPFAVSTHLEADGLAIAEQIFGAVAEGVECRALPGGSVAEVLHALARSESAALLAVGATHHGSAGRAILGSVAERVVHGSPCPVLVVPQGDGARLIPTIGVAYDGRAESRRALRAAEALALRIGASLRLITAIDAGPAGDLLPQHLDELDAALGTHCTDLLERAATPLRERGLQVETQLVRAPASDGIAAACKDGVDLLVCGSRNYGPARSVLLGGVSRQLVGHPPCPVMILPRGAAVAALTAPLAEPAVA